MNKDDIVQVIVRNIRENVEDVGSAEIDPTRSMEAYGANSLDVIEIVSCSMRDLKIKVPRTELAQIRTVDELADKFLQHMQAA